MFYGISNMLMRYLLFATHANVSAIKKASGTLSDLPLAAASLQYTDVVRHTWSNYALHRSAQRGLICGYRRLQTPSAVDSTGRQGELNANAFPSLKKSERQRTDIEMYVACRLSCQQLFRGTRTRIRRKWRQSPHRSYGNFHGAGVVAISVMHSDAQEKIPF